MRKPRYLLYLSLVLTLCACQNNIKYVPYESKISFDDPRVDYVGDGYHKSKDFSELSYYENGEIKTLSKYKDIMASGDFRHVAPSTGNLKALVIPINFADSDTKNNDRQINLIQNAFFGDPKTTTFESLASYYDYSSYGALKITGTVTPFYDYPVASTELNENNSFLSKNIAKSALDWFYKNNTDINITPYDSDGDRYLDLVYFVYNKKVDISSTTATSSLWWAYVDSVKEVEAPGMMLSSFCWISISFLEGSYGKAETHALIHETGHLFGLLDYYNTYSSMHYQPTGYADIMDRNLGDHTALSKMFLNWTTPFVVDNSCTITLRPFNSSGDLLLIPTSKGWNNTPYDEYLVLEYFTPQGLNKNDAGDKFYYNDKNGKTKVFSFLNTNGLKVYHVNARLAYFQSKINRNLIAYQDEENALNKLSLFSSYSLDLAYSNTILDSKVNEVPVLYHLLEATGRNTFVDGNPASSSTLWKNGDTFGMTTFTDMRFENNASLAYTFKVLSMGYNGIKIQVTHKS